MKLLLAALAFAIAAMVQAQAWPSKPIRYIVIFAPGGTTDILARLIAPKLSDALGQPVVVENRPGAGAVIGTDVVAKAAADGHTLLLMSNTHTANENLLPNRPYQLMRDFAPVAAVNIARHALVVHPSVPANSVISTNPPAGTQAAKGSNITLVVSSGPAPSTTSSSTTSTTKAP